MSKRILIVDDNQYVAEASARLISICGYETKAVYGGQAAIEQSIAFAPDMVLMDIGMPDVDGYQAAVRIRLEQRNAAVFLVAVTCRAEEEDKQRALESGFDLHVPKPVSLSTLYGLLAILNRNSVPLASTHLQVLSHRRTSNVPDKANSDKLGNRQLVSRMEASPRCRTNRSLTTAACEATLDVILRSPLPEHEQRKAVEELFTRYAATLPNYG